ncbi:hypothetical protein SPRG_13054 [Saprolegnia parasitica CBS 223.65]|uniref:Uncharacterized protein n=1 Tax=Saprolegnia parasitica (strain CBS 223.65) TaxID=695850 RepID=A0A067BNX2_SAPPC|nr:hypothetical protein SPRG_13054 [Saprolegnia parasitica CBS 223.65]KDO19948.1 hypothetical protein SPRG_13054 [Saprolegnia parasitica CBS 223.65]|eukprot:XP_012209320.1 hypothetical protein SPRG_13054 [Saprolegnia parasitica CBS 223.65]
MIISKDAVATTVVAVAVGLAIAQGVVAYQVSNAWLVSLFEVAHAQAARAAAIVLFLFAAVGLCSLVQPRVRRKVQLVVIFMFVAAYASLFALVLDGIALVQTNIEVTVLFTSYQHQVDTLLNLEPGTVFYWAEDAGYLEWLPGGLFATSPRTAYAIVPNWELMEANYSKAAARTFDAAYCLGQGKTFCDKLPFTSSIALPGIWRNKNATRAVTAALATLPTTFANVPITHSTTINSFCAQADATALALSRSDNMTLRDVCVSCAELMKPMPTQYADVASYIQTTCPLTVARSEGLFCMARAHPSDAWTPIDAETNQRRKMWDDDTLPYGKPSMSECFGHTLQAPARRDARTLAVVLGVLLLLNAVVFVFLWPLRQADTTWASLKRGVKQLRERLRRDEVSIEAITNDVQLVESGPLATDNVVGCRTAS